MYKIGDIFWGRTTSNHLFMIEIVHIQDDDFIQSDWFEYKFIFEGNKKINNNDKIYNQVFSAETRSLKKLNKGTIPKILLELFK